MTQRQSANFIQFSGTSQRFCQRRVLEMKEILECGEVLHPYGQVHKKPAAQKAVHDALEGGGIIVPGSTREGPLTALRSRQKGSR